MAMRYLCQWFSQILLVQDLFGMGKPDIEIWSVPRGVKWTQPVPSGCVGDLCEYSPSPGGKDSEAETDRILKSFWNNETIEILVMKIGAPVFGWGQDRRLRCSWRVYFKATSPWWPPAPHIVHWVTTLRDYWLPRRRIIWSLGSIINESTDRYATEENRAILPRIILLNQGMESSNNLWYLRIK